MTTEVGQNYTNNTKEFSLSIVYADVFSPLSGSYASSASPIGLTIALTSRKNTYRKTSAFKNQVHS